LRSTAKNALQEVLLWSGIALAGLALVYFYDDVLALVRRTSEIASLEQAPQKTEEKPAEERPAAASFSREVRVRADEQGHFVVEAAINGRPITLMADTGATVVVLSFEDAERVGLSPRSLDYTGLARTANGVAKIAPVKLDRVRVKGITLYDIQAAVAERGALFGSLLGMSFLSKLSRFQMQGDELVMEQ
jgi:aspartyl protease family protein